MKLHIKNRRNISTIGPAIILIVLFVIGIIAFTIPTTPQWVQTTWLIVLIVTVLYLYWLVYIRQYFFWNEKEAILKTKGLHGKHFRFEDVAAWEFDNVKLKLRMKSFKTFEFDITKLRQVDKDGLFTLLKSRLDSKK